MPVSCAVCGRVGLFLKDGMVPHHKVPAQPEGVYARSSKCRPLTGPEAPWCAGSESKVTV